MRKATDDESTIVGPSADQKRARLARLLKKRAEAARPAVGSLHRLFEAQAARTPGAVALTFEGSDLSYAGLNARANRLARSLRELGVGPGSRVGLLVERSPEMIVGLLGVLKAGGAYVPLDVVYPEDRLAFVAADAGLPVLLTQKTLLDRVPTTTARVICLDDPDAFAPEAHDLDGGAGPDDVAYVIYTSGSTGRPKGVEVTHANVARLFEATRHWFHFRRDDVWTMFHSFAFDFSVWEIWGALLHGGRLVVVPYWASRSPDAFRDLLRDERVTVLNQTPSAFRQLIRADESRPEGDLLALRLVIFGGEALELQGLRPWFDRHGDRTPRLVNMYGITETTVHVTYRAIDRADLDQPHGSSPIGRAIPDLQVYLLDRDFHPVPDGVIGEIHVGGAGLARGYLGRPGLTADRFIPDPFGGVPGARLYRSGDLARSWPDGGLEYVGRADHQVKVRGFRVELGEIEAAVARHPDVREAVVAAREDVPGDVRLAAYFVPRARPAPSASDLRRHLKQTLPEYMVPASFVALDAFPLTPNGKVDHRALPTPGGSRPDLDGAYVAPRDPAEELIAGVWSAVLGLERVGIFDNFFDLGGHSLLATQVISRLRAAFSVEIPLRPLFDNPTVAGLAGCIESARQGGPGTSAPPIVRGTDPGPAPLSFAQQALWFLDRLAPGRPTFNVSAAVRIAGPLDLGALDRSFGEIVRRHESLRTTFAEAGGIPAQVIAGTSDARTDVVDLRHLPPMDRAAEADRLASEEFRRPFDLARGPLVRARVLRLDDREAAVLLTMHHIITDGWSFGVAAGELAAIYDAFRDGRPSPLADLPIQAADFARWQHQWLRGPALDGLVAYWTGQLAGLRPLELPTDRPRPASRSGRGEVRPFELPADLSRSLIELGRREGVTPFMTLLAAFQTLLHRYAGQDDVAVGSPIANRNRSEVEGLIGYFVNMLVLRGDLSGDPTFRELLARTREAALGAFEHQDLPFDRLVEALHPRRDPSRTPLFQVMFVLQNNQMPDVGRQELTMAPFAVRGGTGTAKFDLTLAMVEADGRLAGSFEYDTDLFDPATIEAMVGHFRGLLEGVAADPGTRVSDLPIGTEAELAEVTATWNRTGADFPRDACVHHLFESQAGRTPDAVALARDGRELTYRELDDRASRLARRLAGRGVRPGVAVGLLVDRSFEMAIGILGVLKAGGAYVPVDPSYPAERMALMLADCSSPVVLTQTHLAARLPGDRADVVLLDADDDGDKGVLPTSVLTADAAYVIYTSGSTGAPRGVVVPHRGVVNHAIAAGRLFGLGPADRVLQFSSISFDIAVEELFPAWGVGASVVLRGDDGQLDPSEFTAMVDRERITVLDLPTAYWHAWTAALASSGTGLPGSLRLVVVGGERALPAAFEAWRSLPGSGRIRWLNTYGPTEATVIATSHEPEAGPGGADLPIGRPIANARVHVLDARMRPVPAGLPGELYIGGEGVARGYLGLPGATADRFLPDPFSAEAGSRMFRTGDLGRWRRDGHLEFLGRVDHQVKVRGFRVEPGEVEAALRRLEGVAAAAVVAVEHEGEGARLVAYVVAAGSGPGIADLRRRLRETLPGPMIPSAFILLDALPMTPSGKVDRRALPTPDGGEVGREVSYQAPRDDVEARLASIWEDVLAVRPVGVADNFFDLGGHSLLAIRLLSRVEEGFGRTLPLSSLFLGATVEDLARLLRTPGGSASRSPLVAIRPDGEGRPFFCVHPAGGIVYCFRELARRFGEGRPFYAFQAPGLDGEGEPLTSLEAMAALYLDEVRRVQPEGPYHLGGWSLGGIVAFEMARRLVERGERVATLALLDTMAPAAVPKVGPAPEVVDRFAALGREVAALAIGDGGLPAGDDPEADAALMAEFASDLAAGFGGDVDRLLDHLRALEPTARRDLIFRHFQVDRVYTEETGPERSARLWAVLRSSLMAGARYRPTPYPGRVTVFRGTDRAARRGDDPSMGWSAWATGGVVAHDIPGDHATILREPGVARLARLLRSEIEAAEAGTR